MLKTMLEYSPVLHYTSLPSFSFNVKKLNMHEQTELFQVFWTLSANLSWIYCTHTFFSDQIIIQLVLCFDAALMWFSVHLAANVLVKLYTHPQGMRGTSIIDSDPDHFESKRSEYTGVPLLLKFCHNGYVSTQSQYYSWFMPKCLAHRR